MSLRILRISKISSLTVYNFIDSTKFLINLTNLIYWKIKFKKTLQLPKFMGPGDKFFKSSSDNVISEQSLTLLPQVQKAFMEGRGCIILFTSILRPSVRTRKCRTRSSDTTLGAFLVVRDLILSKLYFLVLIVVYKYFLQMKVSSINFFS